MNQPAAFTLIELLVVVTIIVVLLALLTPALDRAIYQAELTMCGANLHALGAGVVTYASDQKRYYPARPLIDGDPADWETDGVYLPWDAPDADLRPVLSPYLSVNKVLLDPLSDPVDFAGSEPSTFISVSYNLWFGFKYYGEGAGSSMMRMGNSWTFTSDGRQHRFRTMAADFDLIEAANTTAWASHPDSEGRMSSVAWQDASIVDGGGSGSLTAAAGRFSNLNLTATSWWTGGSTAERGPIDTHALFDDGAVRRHRDVTWDAAFSSNNDGSFARVSHFSDTSKENGMAEAWINAPVR